MKESIRVAAIVILLAFSVPLRGEDGLQAYAKNTENLWRGSGVRDGVFTAISASMIGWGVAGLCLGFAVLAAVLHQDTAGGSGNGHCGHFH